MKNSIFVAFRDHYHRSLTVFASNRNDTFPLPFILRKIVFLFRSSMNRFSFRTKIIVISDLARISIEAHSHHCHPRRRIPSVYHRRRIADTPSPTRALRCSVVLLCSSRTVLPWGTTLLLPRLRPPLCLTCCRKCLWGWWRQRGRPPTAF
jgi:hypothetical protein